MKRGVAGILLLVVLAGCASAPPQHEHATRDLINAELRRAAEHRVPEAPPEAVGRALLPPLGADLPTAKPKSEERRFNLSINNAPANQVFMAVVADTRYSMLVPPEVTNPISLNLKDVTVQEALDTIRELYGYEYKIQGTRIFIQPVTLQSRVFQVNYLMTRRLGRSETRVASGTITGQIGGATGSSGGGSASGTGANGMPSFSGSSITDGSQISTMSLTDFWGELGDSIRAIIGTEAGHSVVVSPQSSIIVVRAFPRELREVENFLRASRVTIERQVMLEAKVVEVTLTDAYQSGINWAALDAHANHVLSTGIDPTRLNIPGSLGKQYGVQNGSIVTQADTSTTPPTVVPTTLGQLLASPIAAGGSGVLGMAFTVNNFQALLSFLETQGTVHVLSSPRVAAINNQKAVLRVGTDDFYVTNVTTTTTAVGSTSTTTPSITVQPFFSGISLDVTPQIDESGNIILHIRPSVSVVSERSRVVNLGTLGSFTLPLASSNINETDTIVRARDGNIVAIGGLMQQSQTDGVSKVPGAGDIPVAGNLFKQTARSLQKRELVFLLKPTVIEGDPQWQSELEHTRERFLSLEAPRQITLPAPAAQAARAGK